VSFEFEEVEKEFTVKPWNSIVKVGDLTPSYFRQNKAEPGVDLPFPILNYRLRGLRKRELTMVTAMSGCGKSTFCKNVAYYLASEKKMKVAMVALEESQSQGFFWFMGMHLRKDPFWLEENPDKVTDEEIQSYINAFRDGLYVHNHFGSLESTRLIDILDYYASEEQVDFIILDHISIAISGLEASREGERKDIDKLVTKLRELIQRTGVGVICISHLRNPPNDQQQWEEGRPIRRNDLRGSGSLAQVSDNIIAIEADLVTDPGKKNDRTLKLIKSRRGREQEAYCDTFQYQAETGHIVVKKPADDVI
jgi:twinkle protein